MLVSKAFAPVLLIVLSGAPVSAQTSLPDAPSSALISQQDQQSETQQEPSSQSEPGANPKPQINSTPQSGSGTVGVSDEASSAQNKQDDSKGKQTKRMLWVVPNFGAVSANTQLPPMSTHEKFVLAARDSVVDYSSYTWAGILAGQAMLLNSDPELGHGIAGYGRYYWRTFTDGVSGTFFTEAIVPSIAHEDPRYYTMEQGGFFQRSCGEDGPTDCLNAKSRRSAWRRKD
jgi:hypothetical protein